MNFIKRYIKKIVEKETAIIHSELFSLKSILTSNFIKENCAPKYKLGSKLLINSKEYLVINCELWPSTHYLINLYTSNVLQTKTYRDIYRYTLLLTNTGETTIMYEDAISNKLKTKKKI
jgi:hypothetical protein